MDKLISLQAAVDALARVARENFNLSDNFNHYLAGLMDVEKAVRDLPEAIIRCRDCKYTDGCEPIEDGRYWCCIHESFMYYCSDAERREQDERI